MSPHTVAWPAVAVIAAGAGLYLWCLWVFATVGRGTPGSWDAPRRVVAVGPYRWVPNPINIAPLLIVIAGALAVSSRRRCSCVLVGGCDLLPLVRNRL